MTDIKDVIHFYLGGTCQLTTDEEDVYTITGVNQWQVEMYGAKSEERATVLLDEIDLLKLRLRPMDSMTREEMYESKITNMTIEQMSIISSIRPAFTVDQFLYLLKKQFDIFSLLESNQAIDKTKVK